jgi:hypothetical protein
MKAKGVDKMLCVKDKSKLKVRGGEASEFYDYLMIELETCKNSSNSSIKCASVS